MNAVAPVYLVIPLSFAYRPHERLRVVGHPLLGRYAIHAMHVPDDRLAFKVASDLPPMDLTAWTGPPKYEAFETLSLWRKVYRCDYRYPPRERRLHARAKGRRGAIPVPMLERREVTFYLPDDRINLVQLTGELMVPIGRVWRCPWWRRGRPIAAAMVDVPPRLG